MLSVVNFIYGKTVKEKHEESNNVIAKLQKRGYVSVLFAVVVVVVVVGVGLRTS